MTEPHLARRLTLPLVVLYGIGVTVGAGIYVLVGAVAGTTGSAAPWAFIVSAVVVAFSALSFAEWSVRRPESAGEAAYVTAGLGAPRAGLAIGLAVACVGVVSAATVSLGTGGYIEALTGLPALPAAIGVAIAMALVAMIGIALSAGLAAVITVIEVGALLIVAFAALVADPGAAARAGATLALPALPVWPMIASGALLAFFAFIGFEDIVNLAEEVIDPAKVLPKAIIWTLVLSTVVYVFVVAVAVGAVGSEALGESAAPIALLAEAGGFLPVQVIAAVGVLAGINGILIQIVMASRVLYGMARRGQLPGILAGIHPARKTPVIATLLATAIVLIGILLFPLERLAALTSAITLVIFAAVNLALIVEKSRHGTPDTLAFSVPSWVPVCGLITAALLLLAGLAA